MEVGSSSTERETPARTGVGVAVALLLALSTLFDLVVDDAFISFTYARNLAGGEGLVFNSGERVEGYTNFLWIVVLAGARMLGAGIEASAAVLGLVAAAVTLLLVRSLSVAWFGKTWYSEWAPVLLAVHPGFVVWARSGMETVPFAMLVTAALWAYVSRRGSAFVGLLLAFATMTRPEGAFWGAAMLAHEMMGRRPAERRLGFVVWAVALYAPYYIWRYTYYGWPAPNTFYAKAALDSAGIVRAARYILDFLGPGAGIVLVIGALLGGRRTPHRILLGVLGGIGTLHLFAVGADFFAFHRFIVPYVPLMVALVPGAALSIRQRRQTRMVVAAAMLGVSLPCYAMEFVQAKRATELNAFLQIMARESSRFFSEQLERGESVAAAGVGMLAYYGHYPVVDMLGLTDEHIAHHGASAGDALQGHGRYDTAYVLARRPEFVVLPEPGSEKPLDAFTWTPVRPIPAIEELRRSAAFRRDYVKVRDGLYRRAPRT